MSDENERQREDSRQMLTVARERVRPLVECGVEVRDDTLFPLLIGLIELRSRLVGRVLRTVNSTW